MGKKKLVIAGASGLVGSAALARFANREDWEVIGVSRRRPLVPLGKATHMAVDLLDQAECARVFGAIPDVTHLIFAALNERNDNLVAGWSDPKQIAKNSAMLSNLFDPLMSVTRSFRHVSLIHGGKAYGVHLAGQNLPMPLREEMPRHAGDNFYHRQEDYVLAKQAGSSWHWTIFRPCMIFGTAVGSNMNTFLALAVLAALRKEAGLDLPNPSGRSGISEPTDADLIAEALEWAMDEPKARNEIFNINNGDLFSLHDGVPIVARCLGMEIGAPRRYDLDTEIAALADNWPGIVERYRLQAPKNVYELLGNSTQVANSWTADVPAADLLRWGMLSTVKIRQAGFQACVSSPDLLPKYIRRFQELRIIPP
jgi:nucleoside-diphosphate-sugar epimerase